MKILRAGSESIFALMEQMFDNGNTAWVVVSGMSMYPFLREDIDMVELERTSFSGIEKGDIVLIKRYNGEYVLHRVVRKSCSDFYIIGDAQQWVEGPIYEDQLKAVAIRIKRKSKVIHCENIFLKMIVQIWFFAVPVRYKFNRLLRLLKV